MDNAATLLGNIAIHPSAARQLTKRGACAVIIDTVRKNIDFRAVLTKLVRAMTNLILTDNAAVGKFEELGAKELVRTIAKTHFGHQALQKVTSIFSSFTFVCL